MDDAMGVLFVQFKLELIPGGVASSEAKQEKEQLKNAATSFLCCTPNPSCACRKKDTQNPDQG